MRDTPSLSLERRRPGRWLASLSLVLVATSARGQEPSPEQDAGRLFREAKAMMAGGHVPEACARFQQSLERVYQLGTLLNLAVCREEEGRLGSALHHFEDALAMAKQSGDADRSAFAEPRLKKLRGAVSRLAIAPAPGAAVSGLELTCDRAVLGDPSWGTLLPVDGGEHTVRATAPGRTPFETTVTVARGGDTKYVWIPPLSRLSAPVAPATAAPGPANVALAEGPAASPRPGAPSSPLVPAARLAMEPQAPPEPPGRVEPVASPSRALASSAPAWRLPAGAAALGLGVAAASVGAAFGGKAVIDNNTSARLCPGNRCPTGAGLTANQDARIDAHVADACIPLGLLAVAAGSYLLVSSRGVRAARARLTPLAGPGNAGVGLGGAW